MSKKFFTWLATLLLVANMNAWAQIDKAAWPAEAPFVAPYPVKKENGAKPIAALEKVGAAETRYFQLISAGTKDDISDDGILALTMVWNGDQYELALEDLTKLNDKMGEEDSRVHLESTLWEVRARKYPNSPVLYYTFINKASQLPLQLGISAVNVNITSGVTDWMWCDGAIATTPSKIDPGAGNVLQNCIRAAVDEENMLYLVQWKNAKKKLGIVATKSNAEVPSRAVIFEAWEANPIVLTADQLNAELGYEDVTTQNKGSKDAMKFTFAPEVEGVGAINVMTSHTFRAEPANEDVYARVAGDPMEGYVRFQAWEGDQLSGKYLMVDTAYYDAEINDKYDLQIAVKPIEYPKYAVSNAADLLRTTDTYTLKNGVLYKNGIERVEPKDFNPANVALAQLKRQTNFKPIFYPSTQSLRLQVEMVFKAEKRGLKDNTNPWWKQMFDQTAGGRMRIVNGFNPELYWNDYAGYFQSYTSHGVPAEFTPLLSWGSIRQEWHHPAQAIDSLTFVAWYGKLPSLKPHRPQFATLAFNNVIKMTTLSNSPKHAVLTCDVRDPYDEANEKGDAGLLTHISLEGLMPIYTEVADIPEGFYYMQNANTINTDLLKGGEYRYEDLAATAATYTYWNALNHTWAVGGTNNVANFGENSDTWFVKNGETVKAARTSAQGNIVYSSDLKEIPSAQWYIHGNGGSYTIKNRESGRKWNTSYWWKLEGSTDTYVNHNAYASGTGLMGGLAAYHRDTVRLIPIADAALRDIHRGYVNLSAQEAAADTSVFRFRFHTLGSEDLFLGEEGGILKVMKENPGQYKLERVMDRSLQMIDMYTNTEHFQDSLVYGVTIKNQPEYQLSRAMYHIYKDNVSSGTTEESGVRIREYITLDGGSYVLSKLKVTLKDGYTTYDPALNNGKADGRKAFYIKQISTVHPDQYVLVDPNLVGRELNVNGSYAQGVRVFVNQSTGEAQPGGLISKAASNVYGNSVFSLEKVRAYNYRDVRTEGNVRDTLTFFKASNPSILLYENSHVAGANVSLLDRINDAQVRKNYSLFVDTANLSQPEKPMFLLAVRPADTFETSNIPEHNRHLYTTADYLVNMVDSAKAGNIAYKYTNVFRNIERTYYRLGFVPAVHKGSSLFITDDGQKEIPLGEGLTKASFAFRFVSTNRNTFYIETIYDGTTPGWVKVLNEVPVVTADIQEAEVYQVKKATSAPTSSEAISTEEGVVIETIQGAVIVKNAAGKTVRISTLLGKPIASKVLSSDSETIAAPAGIVVVAVEGAEAVKTLVK